MAVKVGINGFGRIGRVVFRTCLQNPKIQISAINDPAINAEYVCYLIKFDSTHGKYKGNVTYSNDEVIVDGQHIRLFHEKLPSDIPWQTVGVQYVVEASGMFTSLEKASGHLASEGVKRVIVTAPSVDVPMIIQGVNDNKLKAAQKVLSCASSTLYCLAPIIKVLDDNFGVAEGFMTSIHALTPSLKPLDGLCLRGKHWRDHRSIHQNIIPASTGACKALGKIIPRVRDKLTGLAFRVPVVNVSVLDLTIRLNTNTTLQDIIKAVENVSKSSMRTIIKISDEQAVSSDFNGDSHSCIFDVDSSLQLKPNFYKIICWYENEYSYACRIIDSIFFSENQSSYQIITSNTISVKSSPCKKQNNGHREILSSCSCNNDINTNKILISTSQDTGLKTKISRPSVIKTRISRTFQATSTLNKSSEGNEIFKIWNDSNEQAPAKIKQNRNSFFQSYVVQSAEKTECVKAQERLENVKKEFCKMVNMTENLLKMSCSKFQFSSLATTSKDDVECSGNKELRSSAIDYSISNTDEQVDGGKEKELLLGNCDDAKEIFGVVDIVVKKCSNQEVIRYDNFRDRIENLSCSMLNQNIKSESNVNDSMNSFTQLSNSTVDSKEQVTKTINNIVDELPQNMINANEITTFPVLNCEKGNNDTADDEEVVLKIIEDVESERPPENNTCQTQTSLCYKPHIGDDIDTDKQPETYDMKDLVNYLRSEEYNMRIIDEELKKRNIILVSSQKYYRNSQIFKSCNMDSKKPVPKAEDHSKCLILSKNILEKLGHGLQETEVLVPKNVLAENNITTTGSDCNKPDIFDKLDSASGTDSESSFEINGKKSQVLQMTDLSSSIEDLARLDKICRIIEISDELSDKLFSALDNGVKMESTEWSFKDLCEKINLDEFCNNVFGK